MARLNHPNILPIFDVGSDEAGPFIAMELVEGFTLRDCLRAKPRPWREVVRVFAVAGRALSCAHESGLIHRDFKPSNVMIGHDGRVRVMDFGLARGVGLADGRDTELVAPCIGRLRLARLHRSFGLGRSLDAGVG